MKMGIIMMYFIRQVRVIEDLIPKQVNHLLRYQEEVKAAKPEVGTVN